MHSTPARAARAPPRCTIALPGGAAHLRRCALVVEVRDRRRGAGAHGMGEFVGRVVLRERLLTRGRETPEQIEARLARNALFSGELDDYIRLDNSASLERSVERLLQLLDEHRQCG